MTVIQKIIAGIAIVFAVLIVSVMGYLIGWPIVGSFIYRTSFESSAWKDSIKVYEATSWPVRIQMVDDLLSSKKLIGLKRKDVINLLGKPSDDGYFKEHSIIYWLGPERGFISIDSEWLVFH